MSWRGEPFTNGSYDRWKLASPWDDESDEPLGENPHYGPGNPDWEYDREREAVRG